jgi:hypothetical protein
MTTGSTASDVAQARGSAVARSETLTAATITIYRSHAIESLLIANPEIESRAAKYLFVHVRTMHGSVRRCSIDDHAHSTYRAVVHNSSIAKSNVHARRVTARSKTRRDQAVRVTLPACRASASGHGVLNLTKPRVGSRWTAIRRAQRSRA